MPPGQQRGHQVSEGLAGARARFDHQGFESREGLRHATGHLDLLGARRKAGEVARERPVRTQDVLDWLQLPDPAMSDGHPLQ